MRTGMLECLRTTEARAKDGESSKRKQRHEELTSFPDMSHCPKWVIHSCTSVCLEKRYRCAKTHVYTCVFNISTELMKTLKIGNILKVFYSIDETLINRMLLKRKKQKQFIFVTLKQTA
jgi:hypothetical protein